MSCDNGKISTKKKFIIFSSVGLAIAIATYLVFTTTNNPAIAAALPALLSLGACPLMCAIVGGLMWFSRRSSTRKDNCEGNHDRNAQIATNNTKDETPLQLGDVATYK
jgi:hypothetical protein